MKYISLLTNRKFEIPEGAEACRKSGHIWRVGTKLIHMPFPCPGFGQSKPFKICARCDKKGDLNDDSE